MKKLVVGIVFLFAFSCVTLPSKKPAYVFCDHVNDLFEKKLAELHKGLLSQEGVSNAIFSNSKLVCENNRAYAGWYTVLEMTSSSSKVCAAFNTIVSFTDAPDEVVYKLLYVSEGEAVACLVSL